MITLDEFKVSVRLARGKLTKHDDDLMEIHTHGIAELLEFTLKQKLMGIKNISHIATTLTRSEQLDFCTWMAEKGWKAEKNEMELQLLSYGDAF